MFIHMCGAYINVVKVTKKKKYGQMRNCQLKFSTVRGKTSDC